MVRIFAHANSGVKRRFVRDDFCPCQHQVTRKLENQDPSFPASHNPSTPDSQCPITPEKQNYTSLASHIARPLDSKEFDNKGADNDNRGDRPEGRLRQEHDSRSPGGLAHQHRQGRAAYRLRQAGHCTALVTDQKRRELTHARDHPAVRPEHRTLGAQLLQAL